MLVAVETAGPDAGTAASSPHPRPAPLAQFTAGECRTRESDSGGIGPSLSPACSSPIFPGDWWGHPVPPHLCCAWSFSSHRTSQLGWETTHWTLAITSPPSHLGGWIQPSHQVPHGSSRPSCPQESLLHRHQDFTHPVHRQNATQTWGRWDTVPSHTGSPISVTKPCHSPGRCLSGAHLPPIPGSSPLRSRAAQLVRDAGMMEYPAGAEEARQNLSIHQGPHFLPSALGDN